MTDLIHQYTLMHREIPVAELKLDSATSAIISVDKVYKEEHIPVGIPVRDKLVDRRALNAWWQGRTIPASRSGLQDALKEMGVAVALNLSKKCMGLSLSDQYWICPKNSGILWKQVNFFENSFSDDVGDILFGRKKERGELNLMSPDNTSDGWLKKRWAVIDGRRCLIKGGSGATQQEPYNEVLASCIMERLHIPHVSYTLLMEEDYPYSICEDFITQDTELVTAWYIMQTVKKPNHISVYQHYMNCCEVLGVPGVEEAVNQMLALDYMIVNEDRHQNNFGVIRKADTLEYVGAAPVYDSGTSLWFDKPTGMIRAGAKVICKPFKNSHEEQIRLVTDFSWLSFSALAGIDEELRELVRDSMFIDESRCNALCRGLNQRIKMLSDVALSVRKSVFFDSVQHDVKENTAYSGKAT